MTNTQKYISSKDIAKKYNIPYSTVTHYTNIGLFDVAARRGNRRLYDEDEVGRRLAAITKLIGEGYPLRLIRKMLTGNDVGSSVHNAIR